ncbi:hypothetical protein [Kribbella sp. NPDC049584]|uniref:hypothetical protein n=1 Tax=Kribbella sp. NPDC049584 TaxID=3154833 RepID=UPI0034207D0F
MNPERTDQMIKSADVAYEAIRFLNHATIAATVPAPVAYALLGSLSQMQDAVAKLAGQIATGLDRSLLDFDVYDDARDPAESVAMAADALERTSGHARAAAERVSAAQAAIALQGFYLDKEDE